MIVITAGGKQFEYNGNIELRHDEDFLWVTSYKTDETGNLTISDAFWVMDVDSIVGVIEDDNKP